MLLLTSVSDKIQLVTAQNYAVGVHASWVDLASGNVTPGRANTEVSTATTTDIVAAPSASTYRNLKTLFVKSNEVLASQSVSIQHTDGTTSIELYSDVLGANECIQYTEETGFVKVGGSIGVSYIDLFHKADSGSVAFSKTGAGTVSLKAGSAIGLNGLLYHFTADTAITMPALTAGTDYAIYLCNDGTLHADANFSAPSGFTTATSRQIGGFHYAPGGNAVSISKVAVTAGTTIGAQTVPINTWALYLLSISAAGSITVTPAAANATTGYASEALAIAAMPVMPAGNARMGYITVLTKSGTTWIAGTDALAGGSSGNVATTTNYYPSLGAAQGLTLSRGSTDTNIASSAFSYFCGGDTTPAINEYSLWDLKWRPACSDPRGMALVAGKFWSDLYLLGVNHITAGTSANNQTIADGSSPPKIPVAFGGDGTAAYGDLTWWTAAEVLSAYGKRLPRYSEFCALAYGVTENTSRGTDAVTTGIGTSNAGTVTDEKFTSKWGAIQAAGIMWIWVNEFGGPYAAASWVNDNGGRGQDYNMPNAAIEGGNWGDGANTGSRASYWSVAPSISDNSVGARGCCDHVWTS